MFPPKDIIGQLTQEDTFTSFFASSVAGSLVSGSRTSSIAIIGPFPLPLNTTLKSIKHSKHLKREVTIPEYLVVYLEKLLKRLSRDSKEILDCRSPGNLMSIPKPNQESYL